jgi:hypothetical protein
MLGIPVLGIHITGNLSFNVVSRYLAIDCSTVMLIENSTVFQSSSTGMGAGYFAYSRGGNFVCQFGGYPDPALANKTVASLNMASPNDPNIEYVSFFNCSMAP